MPEIKGFWYTVEVRLQITRPEIDHMIECSESHYDGRCKAASQQGGFLYGWRNQVQWAKEKEGKDVAEVEATRHQMDTLCKILEMRRPNGCNTALYSRCRQILTRIGEESKRVNSEKADDCREKDQCQANG